MNAASKNGHLEVVKLLLDQGVDATVPNCTGQMPFHCAALGGHIELLNLFLTGNHPRVHARPIYYGTGPVQSPHLSFDPPVSSAIDVNALGGDYGTPLYGASYKGHLKVLQMLVEKHNADVTATDQQGRTPLHLAARGGNIHCVNYLLEQGLRCSDADKTGESIIHYACSGASPEVVRRLLEVDPIVVNSSTIWTPLH